jgi:hypothetical protein
VSYINDFVFTSYKLVPQALLPLVSQLDIIKGALKEKPIRKEDKNE